MSIQKVMAPRCSRGAIAFHLEIVRRLELYRDARIERRLGAGATRTTGHAVDGSRAGKRGGVVIEPELVLPVAKGAPDVNEVRVFRAPDRLGSIHGQTDRLGVEFDLGVEHLVSWVVRQRFGIRALRA